MAAKFGAEVGAHVGGAKVFPAAARSLTRSLMRVWAPSRGSRAARAWPTRSSRRQQDARPRKLGWARPMGRWAVPVFCWMRTLAPMDGRCRGLTGCAPRGG